MLPLRWWPLLALVLVRGGQGAETDEDEGTDRTGCPGAFHHKCHCDVVSYESVPRFVVNCTQHGFTSAEALQHLPPQTEVLIFTGNRIPELHWNVFGMTSVHELLKVVDMSNNHIQEIKGKTYHKVSHVERLILNHNSLNISLSRHHPRIFSNFASLRSLHLTNAFADGSHWRVEDLRDIFLNSNLTKLEKIHLEQNEMVLLDDPRLFCELPSLMDLHLGDNNLVEVKLDLTCLNKIRYVDLERNKIQTLSQDTLDQWDSLAEALTSDQFSVNLIENPFECDCRLQPFLTWLNKTKVDVMGKQKLRCHTGFPEENAKKHLVDIKHLSCRTTPRQQSSQEPPGQAGNAALGILIGMLFAALFILAYIKRDSLKGKLRPVVDTVTRRVRYSTIGKVDEPEVEV